MDERTKAVFERAERVVQNEPEWVKKVEAQALAEAQGKSSGEKHFGVTGYQMLIAMKDAAKERKTVLSLHCMYGDQWVVTETDQKTKTPRQLGKVEAGMYEALQSAGDFKTEYAK